MVTPFRGWVIAKIVNVKRIFKEQFPPDVQKWIDQLLYPLNNAIAQFTFAFNNNITLSDNAVAVTKTFTIVGSTVFSGDMVAGAATLTNCKYYQYNAPNVTQGYGLQVNVPVQGIGIPQATLVSSISGTNVVLSAPCTATQLNAKILAGGQFPYTFQHGLATRPTILLLDSVLETSASPPTIMEGVYVDWFVNGSNIVINNITGLVAGRSYNVTVTSLAG